MFLENLSDYTFSNRPGGQGAGMPSENDDGPWSGTGTAAGAASGPVEETDDASSEFRESIEIPIGMPLPASEVQRLKTEAQRHRGSREPEGKEPPAESDTTDNTQ